MQIKSEVDNLKDVLGQYQLEFEQERREMQGVIKEMNEQKYGM
jgi:hypothetical protein